MTCRPAGVRGAIGSRLEQGRVVRALEPDQAFLDRLQFGGHGMKAFQALALHVGFGESREGRVNLHELKRNLFAGFLNGVDGGVSFHGHTDSRNSANGNPLTSF